MTLLVASICHVASVWAVVCGEPVTGRLGVYTKRRVGHRIVLSRSRMGVIRSPADGSLDYRDYQLFMKRLRKFAPGTVRFSCVASMVR